MRVFPSVPKSQIVYLLSCVEKLNKALVSKCQRRFSAIVPYRENLKQPDFIDDEIL